MMLGRFPQTLSFVILTLATWLSVSAADVTFLVTSDSHYDAIENEDRNERDRVTIEQMNRISEIRWPEQLGGDRIAQPRGVAVLGDVIDDGDRMKEGKNQSELQFRYFLADFGLDGTDGRLKYPVFEGWGNHDGPPIGKERFGFSFQSQLKERNKHRLQKGLIAKVSDNGLHYSWDWGGVHFVQLNLYPGNTPHPKTRYSAVYHDPQHSLDFLKADLKANVGTSGRPVVVMHHYDLQGSNWWHDEERRAYYDTVKDYNVVAVFHGHTGTGVYRWKPEGENRALDVINTGQTEKGFFVVQITDDRIRLAYRMKEGVKTVKESDGRVRREWAGDWGWRHLKSKEIANPEKKVEKTYTNPVIDEIGPADLQSPRRERFAAEKTDWFHEARWGVMTHYLGAPPSSSGGAELTAEMWNKQIDAFDVRELTDQLASTGAKYLLLTIGQNSGHYCAPNATYDKIVGITPSKCSRRDLVADLAEALKAKDIRLMVYLPSGAPAADAVARKKLGWRWGRPGGWQLPGEPVGGRLVEFQRNWETVIREWSLRWGKDVAGWWIDGCYFADEMYRFEEEPNFASLSAALRAGNPDSIVAFNPGIRVPVVSHTRHEDYAAGEVNLNQLPKAVATCPGRWLEREGTKVQLHILTFLGTSWCRGDRPQLPDEQIIAYTRQITAKDGVVTYDVPIQKSGLIPQPFVEQLQAVGQAMKGKP